jgi:tetratricopeptide (TPR) repeat protein
VVKPMPMPMPVSPLQKNSAPAVSTGKPMGTLGKVGAYTGAPLKTMPQPGVPSRPPRSRGSSVADGNRGQFYGILLIIAAIVMFIIAMPSKKKEEKTFRTSQQVEYDLLQSSDEKKRLQERLEIMQTTTAKRSQENLIKGFRDYQQGNYARARDNFQVVLNLDPDNAIAKRYYHLSKIKFDEMLQFHMLQGLRYRDKKNYRLCRSSFQAALVMIQNSQQHPKYREIKNFFDECDLALEGRF